MQCIITEKQPNQMHTVIKQRRGKGLPTHSLSELNLLRYLAEEVKIILFLIGYHKADLFIIVTSTMQSFSLISQAGEDTH